MSYQQPPQQPPQAQAQQQAPPAQGQQAQAQQAVPPHHQILVTTMNDIPGYEVVAVYGEIFGLVARARNVFSNIGASFRTITGGEVRAYTQLLSDSRDQSVDRLREAAYARGANAVIAMRFDCNEIANMISEVAAYGTAVVIRPVGQAQ